MLQLLLEQMQLEITLHLFMLFHDTPAGSAGKTSGTGWLNMGVFEYYVTEHFA